MHVSGHLYLLLWLFIFHLMNGWIIWFLIINCIIPLNCILAILCFLLDQNCKPYFGYMISTIIIFFITVMFIFMEQQRRWRRRRSARSPTTRSLQWEGRRPKLGHGLETIRWSLPWDQPLVSALRPRLVSTWDHDLETKPWVSALRPSHRSRL